MQYVMSLSGGKASAVAAERAVARYGKDVVTLWFADTAWEDEDLHRFLGECVLRWGCTFVTYKDGRNPLQVAEDVSFIPNQKRAPCTLQLKVLPFQKYVASLPKPLTVLIGLDWREQHRMVRPKAAYEAIEGVSVDFPLMWKPYEYQPYETVIRAWGIEPPRLYAAGFPHNNCGGRCVKQGVGEWLRLRDTFPERFAEVRDWEAAQRAKGGARAGYAIARDQRGGVVRPLTLAEIEKRRGELEQPKFDDDMFGCFCATE